MDMAHTGNSYPLRTRVMYNCCACEQHMPEAPELVSPPPPGSNPRTDTARRLVGGLQLLPRRQMRCAAIRRCETTGVGREKRLALRQATPSEPFPPPLGVAKAAGTGKMTTPWPQLRESK